MTQWIAGDNVLYEISCTLGNKQDVECSDHPRFQHGVLGFSRAIAPNPPVKSRVEPRTSIAAANAAAENVSTLLFTALLLRVSCYTDHDIQLPLRTHVRHDGDTYHTNRNTIDGKRS